jgi:bifunctional non-homologous end joining protein LigD
MAKKKLSEYRAKRDFKKTAEPAGKTAIRSAEYPRFVIQKHDATRLHYDLRLEVDGVFRSWAVTKGPSLDPHDKRLAVEVEDHPLDYGDFEGTIPKGEYGGGTVMVWDRGFWMPEGNKSAAEQLRDGELKLVFAGQKLKGSWVLVRMKGDRFGGKRTNWLLIKHRDEWAKDGDGDKLLNKDRSAASGRTMGQIARGEGKAPESFMLSKSRTKLAKSDAIWHSSKSAEQASTPARRSRARKTA